MGRGLAVTAMRRLAQGANAGRHGASAAGTGAAQLRRVAGQRRVAFAVQARGFAEDEKAKAKAKAEAEEAAKKEQENAQEEQGGIFSKLRQELEKDPEIKKTLDELRQSRVGDKSAAEAASNLSDKASQATEQAKERTSKLFEEAKESSGKAFEKTAEQAEEAKATANEFMEELKKQFGFKSGSGATASNAEGAQATGKGEAEAGPDAGPAKPEGEEAQAEAKPSMRSRFRSMREKVWEKLPQSFANDDRSWEDAFKAVFGIKSERKKPQAAAAADASGAAEATNAEGLEEWFEAVDKETGDRYYYNKAGETKWERPENAKIIRDADEEAHAWAEHVHDPEPTFLEVKIKEISGKISELEEQRDAAMGESDMAKFKELNKTIREMRKEIEKLSAQANTTAVVHVEEKKGAWEKFNDRLKEAPILKNIFGIADSDVARKARDAAEDAREALETSQNPLVYRMYSVYDSMFAETEMGEAIREFRRMDPEFTIEGFLEEVQEDLAPTVVSAFLRGDIATLEEYCAEGAAAAVKASIKDRQAAGRKSDTNILSIGEIHLAAAKVVEKMGPLIVVQFMVQQINCLYDLKGNVVEGKEDEIVGVFYIFALTREYDEPSAEFKWRIKEFAIGGTTPYI